MIGDALQQAVVFENCVLLSVLSNTRPRSDINEWYQTQFASKKDRL